MRRVDSLEKTLMLGGIGGRRRGDDRGWDGWMASLTRWTWVWVNSRSWWWTGRPDVLQFMELQRVRHDWMTELNWTERIPKIKIPFFLCFKVFKNFSEHFFVFKLKYSWFITLCLLLYSKVTQLYTYRHYFFHILFHYGLITGYWI